MTDYSKYPYSRMLQYIEKRSLELGRKNHIDYILSMEKAETMEKLIDIYNHAFQYLAILFFGTRKVPHGWYIVETWGYKNDYLLEELNWCLNENILRWFKRQESPSNELTLSALSNLHKSKNIVIVQNEILKISTPQADYGVKTLFYIRDKQYDMRRPNSNYRYNKHDYLYCSGYLAAHGHIFDIIENTCGKNLGISYDNVAIDYKKEVEREEKRKEDERIELEKEKRKILIGKITIGVLIIPIAILICYIMHEVGLIGIIIIIGFIGAIPKVFLTGHL